LVLSMSVAAAYRTAHLADSAAYAET